MIQFYFLLSHLDAFIYHFFCLLALARRLNSSGENGHVEQNGFVPSPLGKLTVFNIDYVVICGVFIGYLYNVEGVPVYSHFLSVFIMTGC